MGFNNEDSQRVKDGHIRGHAASYTEEPQFRKEEP